LPRCTRPALGEHERALGGWQAELVLVPEIAGALGSALDFLDTIAAGLVVRAERMRANLEAYGEGQRDTRGAESATGEILADLAPYLS
jgi:adenylosuccinate lyase